MAFVLQAVGSDLRFLDKDIKSDLGFTHNNCGIIWAMICESNTVIAGHCNNQG